MRTAPTRRRDDDMVQAGIGIRSESRANVGGHELCKRASDEKPSVTLPLSLRGHHFISSP